ncbi:MAG: FG-GAP repeat domain-containing protein [Nitrospinales bacterium]
MKKYFLLLIAAGFMLGCPPGASQKPMPPVFSVAGVLDTGAEPSFLITEDFNGDGNLDLVVTNSGDNTFSFYKGQGDGAFRKQVVFRTGDQPICIVTGDFNGDGLPDLAELNYRDQNIQVFLNNGLGSFRNTGVLLKPGKIPLNLVAGDLNKDGFTDLAVTLRYHKVVILWGRGKGRFSEPVSIPVRGQPTSLVLGDYNGDHQPDLAVALAGSGNVGAQIIWGMGSNGFKTSQVFRGGGQPLSIANIDANGDGRMDLVTSSNSTHIIGLFLNKGGGVFESLRDFAAGEFPKFVAVADFTGDGKPDLAVSNATNDTISVVLGKGDGRFTYPPIFHAVDEYPQGIVVGDFNHDGLMDLVTACRDKNLLDILLKRKSPAAPPGA